jgi:hypothetical protein
LGCRVVVVVVGQVHDGDVCIKRFEAWVWNVPGLLDAVYPNLHVSATILKLRPWMADVFWG